MLYWDVLGLYCGYTGVKFMSCHDIRRRENPNSSNTPKKDTRPILKYLSQQMSSSNAVDPELAEIRL